jgi:hypothetical protein
MSSLMMISCWLKHVRVLLSVFNVWYFKLMFYYIEVHLLNENQRMQQWWKYIFQEIYIFTIVASVGFHLIHRLMMHGHAHLKQQQQQSHSILQNVIKTVHISFLQFLTNILYEWNCEITSTLKISYKVFIFKLYTGTVH